MQTLKPLTYSSIRLFNTNQILKAEEIQLTQDRIVKNLSEELKSEKEASSEFEEPQVPNGFKLNKWDGVGIIELTKNIKKGQIIIQFHINDINLTENDAFDDELGEEAEEFLNEIDYDDGTTIEASVLLVKNGRPNKLLFDLEIFKDSFGIDEIRSINNLELERSELGPYDFEFKLDYDHGYSEPFFEMAEDIKEGYEKYLESNGVDDNLVNFIREFAEYREQKEYERWIENGIEFFQTK